MKVIITLLCAATAAATAASIPNHNVNLNVQRRSGTRPAQLVLARPPSTPSTNTNSHNKPAIQAAAAVSSSVSESTRGGATLSPPSSSSPSPITSVSGSFRIPSASMPVSGPTAGNENGLYGASFWIGLDSSSSSCSAGINNTILRAGVDIFWDGNAGGAQTPVAWYELYPTVAPVDFNITLAAGDNLRITADQTTGTVTLENFGQTDSTRKAVVQTVTHTFPTTGTGGSTGDCAVGAWVVEDFPLAALPDYPVALVNFTEAAFRNLKVVEGAKNGKNTVKGTPVTGNIVLEAQGGQLTDCTVHSAGDVRCVRTVGSQ
ncbi:putative acid proteinase [Diplogelasinospora grovesii]|uniref:Acid proteinase n=1 Tax=Diplogelasinospora grovesii TaxID=303347 RepID=A0AAN6NGL8_9PEZI|nr:putative acid proteinase [Diplogelasinospora grovesii]